MPKDPAFQFYVKDWLTDPELQATTSATRGIWINALCFMWQAHERGKLVGNRANLARLLNCTLPEFEAFLQEAETSLFCHACCNGDGIVTLINRRMYREERERKLHRKRQYRYRQKKGDAETTEKSDGYNADDMTAPSPSPSTTSPKKEKKKRKEKSGLVAQADQVILYLNERTGKGFQSIPRNRNPIIARLKEKFTVEDCKRVVDIKLNDPYFLEHPEFLRPQTLFGTKMESYLQKSIDNRPRWRPDE